jgi:hypothetical protein
MKKKREELTTTIKKRNKRNNKRGRTIEISISIIFFFILYC